MKFFWAIVAFLFLGACQTEERPNNIMERDAFKAALLDAQMIEARMNHELVLEQMAAIPAEKYYEEMFQEHGITKAEFDTTFNWYTYHPVEMKTIYEEIITELSLRKDTLR